ncbi:MAG: glycoside hydrolase family 2 protein [Chloroflexota bacterium]
MVQRQSLNASWEFSQAHTDRWHPATVPGCVHTDLRAAGQVADPYYRDNESDLQWIGETAWIYRRTFTVDSNVMAEPVILLQCNGLDTLAEITLNGETVARTANQFIRYEFDVKSALKEGENTLSIYFESALLHGQEKLKERYIHSWSTDSHKLPGGNYVRKSQCNFGWDWGPKLVTCGIWRDISLVGIGIARIGEVLVEQMHDSGVSERRSVNGEAVNVGLLVNVSAEVADTEAELVARLELSLDGNKVFREETVLEGQIGSFAMQIPDPQLWWPNGLGEQPLYTVKVTLIYAGMVLDQWSKRIGLRQLNLVTRPDAWGESFYFECNGVPFFSKGANWIPADTFVNAISDDLYKSLLVSAAEANMNMLRVWGGGIYEQEIFYDLCDELGLCVWQDFMFACATYPSFDRDFMANVTEEAEYNIRRIRHHASLALWCGNNELEQGLVADEWNDLAMSWQDYARLFDHLLRDLVAELDPHTDYWPGSPHSPYGNRLEWNNPNWGDAHIWDVWHGNQPFEFYRTCMHRFNSEFGFQSLPEPATLDTVLADEDKNLTSYVMEHHQRSPVGNSKIMTYMLEWFQLPNSFENTAWLSQILQGMAVKYAVEHWRRSMPRGMGTLYWQLNDCWPVASWSSLDSLGAWKGLHYMARHFFSPTLLSAVEDLQSKRVTLHVTHDRPTDLPLAGLVTWELIKASDGALIESGSLDCSIYGPANQQVGDIDLSGTLTQYDSRNLLVNMRLEIGGKVASSNMVHLARPKHLSLSQPELTFSVEQKKGAVSITAAANRPALWTWLEVEGSAHNFSDNFFHLFPGEKKTVTYKSDSSAEELASKLSISSLWDTF